LVLVGDRFTRPGGVSVGGDGWLVVRCQNIAFQFSRPIGFLGPPESFLQGWRTYTDKEKLFPTRDVKKGWRRKSDKRG
jgi:hypothetical protein